MAGMAARRGVGATANAAGVVVATGVARRMPHLHYGHNGKTAYLFQPALFICLICCSRLVVYRTTCLLLFSRTPAWRIYAIGWPATLIARRGVT